ncbi:hypothetical protein FA95DRAFT_1268515 [Auriscalpium vulgare]|uniref:Uncharacterized protein n=1 Tax=Auriscalpium vulgare TaxID=40419 RepID=A0ACB8RTK0_9AGAM|nr:hypothetical protein FA95DRAFT_1268515 [Auriscalpium vulgare]
MAPFSKLLTSVLVAMLYASTAVAAPWPSDARHATHRVRLVGRDAKVKLEAYHPTSSYETFGVDGLDHPLAKRDGFDLEGATVSFVKSKLDVGSDSVKFRSGYQGDNVQHAFVKQQESGIPFANAVANIAFNGDGKVVAFGSSFIKPSVIADNVPTVSLEDAIATAEKTFDGTYNGHPATLEYLARDDNTAALTHVIQIQNEATGTWVEAFVDAHSNKVLSVVDFVTKATYHVLPISKETLLQGFEDLVDPQDPEASPDGWHSDGTTANTTTTAGNNVIAYKSTTTGVAKATTLDPLTFDYTQDPTQQPTVAVNVAAAVTNAFYIVNSVHDISYRYGFTESAYNFQTNNFGNGGAGNDRVTVSVQDSAGTDNADFSTPADGQSGHMRMYLFTATSPERDGALENDVVIHENTHGISNRLTGGGTGRCLQTTEAGGLGEGWSDAFADWNQQGSDTKDYVLGQYLENNTGGIRTYPYSTSSTTNPLRYSSLKTKAEVHAIGEVWANLLHNVYAALVDEYGWSATATTDPTTSEGNVVWLHLFIDSLAIQPCSPTFVTARDAWIQADATRYGGANKCLLWKAFASRGLGVNAASYTDDSSVPADC